MIDRRLIAHPMQEALEAKILDQIGAAIVYVDRHLRIRYMNSAAEMLFGVSARRTTGEYVQILLPDSQEFCQRLELALHDGNSYSVRALHLPLGPDHEIIVDGLVTPVRDTPGAPGLVIEMLQVDRHLRLSREEGLLAQQQASRAVVRGLAHEIKNPLGGLRGAAQLLERELDSAELKEYTQIIMSEADRLQTLVDAILGPNRLPCKQEINIHEAVERVRMLVEAEEHSGVAIRTDYDPSLPNLIADRDQLIQALLNVVRNALQAVEEQANRGELAEIVLRTRSQRQLTIGARHHKLVIRIDVIDNGPGILPDLREHIFYPMVTGRPTGSGLGLSIAQDLISSHGGIIEFDSRPGLTQFTLLLPLEPLPNEC